MKPVLFIAVLSLLSFLSCHRNTTDYQNILRPVRIAEVGVLQSLNKIYTGVVEAEEYTELAFRMGGPLIEMNVDAGEKIRKGKVIAVVDPLDYESRYEAARAAYITARSQLERNKRLLAMEAISLQEYETSQARFSQTESAYLTARNILRDTRLLAPFDGFVEEKYVENYQKVQPGQPVIRLVNPNQLAIRFTLPETSVRMLREQVGVKVEFDIYKGIWFDARIREYVDASPDGGGIPVKVMIDDTLFDQDKQNIYPGFSARVSLQVKNEIPGSFMIPLAALFEDLSSGQLSVWLYRTSDQTVEKRRVIAEQLFGQDKVLVREGLRAEDLIVVDGVNFITEGQKVKVIKNEL